MMGSQGDKSNTAFLLPISKSNRPCADGSLTGNESVSTGLRDHDLAGSPEKAPDLRVSRQCDETVPVVSIGEAKDTPGSKKRWDHVSLRATRSKRQRHFS